MSRFPDWEFWVAFACVVLAAVLSVVGIVGAVLGAYHWQWMPFALFGMVSVVIAMVIASEMP